MRCRRRGLRAVVGVALVAWACGDDPVGPGLPVVEAAVAAGDGQFGTPGQVLAQRLQVVIRSAATGGAQADVTVVWDVASGDASFATSPATVTDSTGSAYASVRLGATIGEVKVRATVSEQSTATATFTVFTVDRPVLQGLSATEAAAGASIQLEGSGFSTVTDQNVVLFSGIRGRVTAASAGRLTVDLPACMPSRSVRVTVQLGELASAPQSLSVIETEPARVMSVGGVVDVAGNESTCLRVSGAGGAQYLAVVASTSTVGAAMYGFSLVGLSESPVGSAVSRPEDASDASPFGTPDPQEAWDRRLRESEADMIGERSVTPESGPMRAPVAVPVVGQSRSFKVFNGTGFDDVTGVARFVGTGAALYVDQSAAVSFSATELEAFSQRFDAVIQPTIAQAFGTPSDLDGDERIAILFTPSVNRLTPRGSVGFVGGFFYGLDLLPERPNSNGGEIFYTLVPDPTGQYGDARDRTELLSITPAILAHEYQHIVEFNERVLRLGATNGEALWLNEALAVAAEELVSRRYDAAGDPVSAELFRFGNRSRARRYLAEVGTTSVIVSSGQGSLAERGAGLLQMLYLVGQQGESVLGRLTRTTRTGIDNMNAASGTPWVTFLMEWWSAVYLDGSAAQTGVRSFPGMDVRSYLKPPFPLVPESTGSADFIVSGSLWSSSARYYILEPSLQGSTTLRLGGASGASVGGGSSLRIRLVRVR